MKTIDQILDELEEDEEYDKSYCDIDTLLRMSFDDLEYSFIFNLLVYLSMTNISIQIWLIMKVHRMS